jgi:hypothetical protein
MFTNGSTAMDCSGTRTSPASPLSPAPLCQTNVFVSNNTIAKPMTAKIQRSSLLPVCAVIESPGSISPLAPQASGVNS